MKSKNHPDEQNLIAAVRECLKQKNMTLQEGAQALGISHVHFASMLNGVRRISGLSQEKQDALAAFLGIRKSEMFVLAGILNQKDIMPAHSCDRVKATLLQIQKDPEFRMFRLGEADIDTASDRIKLLIAVLYEKVIIESLRARAVVKEETV